MLIFSLFLKFKSKLKYSDSELLSLFKEKNDNIFFAELFKRYTKFVFAVSIKYLKDEDSAKESVMQIFEKLLLEINNYEISNFKSWLHSVTRNHCLHIIRKKSNTAVLSDDLENNSDYFMESDNNLYQDDEKEKEIMIDNLQNSMQKLKEEQRVCVELFYLKDKCYEEVSEITGYSMKEVKSYIQNGKRNLKLILTGQK